MKAPKIVVIGFFMVFIAGIILSSSVTAPAATCSLFVIKGQSEGVEPMNMNIKAGNCVVFMNFAGGATSTEEVKALLRAGEQCLAATESLVGLAMDENKCLASGWLRYGQTPSAVFVKPGVYTYEVLYRAGGPSTKGTITVK